MGDVTLAERIYEIVSSDDYIPLRDIIMDRETIEGIKADAHPEDVPYECIEAGFVFGVAFALTQPEPLEPLWSVSARAREIADEVSALGEQHMKELHLRRAAERGERLAPTTGTGGED